ncbi:MAG: MbtH family NRPS accessory protein [Cyanobacteria bacterium J06650_10]
MSNPIYRVVISTEGRYSLWPAYKEIPWGWRADGTTGTKEDCLAYIDKTWTDMRPQSLQNITTSQSSTSASQ